MPRLIGINGYRTSGKDTTYGIIRDLRPDLKVERVAFADKLKQLGCDSLGINDSDFPLTKFDKIELMDEFKETGVLDVAYGTMTHRGSHINGRQFLQNLGVAARELFGPQFWVDQVLPNPWSFDWLQEAKEALNAEYPCDILCVTDVRFPNEAQRILDLDGEVWEIVRPGLASDGHSSEVPLPRELVTDVIQNDSTIDVLTQRIATRLETASA